MAGQPLERAACFARRESLPVRRPGCGADRVAGDAEEHRQRTSTAGLACRCPQPALATCRSRSSMTYFRGMALAAAIVKSFGGRADFDGTLHRKTRPRRQARTFATM